MKTDSFTVTTVDDEGNTLSGKFTAKLKLSHRENLRQDEIRRQVLGEKSTEASLDAQQSADVFATLSVRLTEWPSWWKDNGFGMDFTSVDPVLAVSKGLEAMLGEHRAKLKTAGEAAKKDLATDVKP